MSTSNKFPEFDHDASQLSKFIATVDMVTIMLKNGSIIHYSPKDMAAFIKWLLDNNIYDIKKNK